MKWLPIVLFASWLPICALAGPHRGGAPVQLLTAEEAARPDLPQPQTTLPSVKGFSKADTSVATAAGAPQILVDTPEGGAEVSAPFPVKIRFVPSPGAKINVGSVRIEVLKMVAISLLSRVKPYLSSAGINVPEAKIPAGTYNVRIAVADDQGREGTTVQVWTVR